MNTEQQKQAQEYFNQVASAWHEKAKLNSIDNYNLIARRNEFVINFASSLGKGNALDIGCGSGELICELAKLDFVAQGIDFSSNMISICQERALAQHLDKALFKTASIFDVELENSYYDIISAIGFIEYISPEQLNEMMSIIYSACAINGHIFIHSRNRLYNIFSLNEYTKLESSYGTIEKLIAQAVDIANADDMVSCIERLRVLHERLPRLPNHPTTEITVDVRYQYTPACLVEIIEQSGFVVEDIYPVHYHGLIPKLANKFKELHVKIANILQDLSSSNNALIPFSSSYIIRAKKR